jgi:Ser/Thr protein kinase RdoA (MazF antagonist)
MMPLNEIDRLKQTVTDTWASPVADRTAALWGYPPGTAKWWRSSASHVFVIPDPNGKRYLRFVPDGHRGAASFAAVADLMARLADRGVPAARPVASQAGPLVATADTPLGIMHAMVVEAAPGEGLDAGELDEAGARAWGTALARLHRDAADLGEDLPGPFEALPLASSLFSADTDLMAAVAVLEARMRELSRDSSGFGVVHGDFELDNLAWQDGTATAFDFDEACRGWYAADVAFALRDLTDDTGSPAAEHRERFAAFLDGYRSVRPLAEADLPLFAGLHAVCALVQITRALREAGEDEPEWKADLRRSLTAMAAEHRELAINAAVPFRTLEDLEGEG